MAPVTGATSYHKEKQRMNLPVKVELAGLSELDRDELAELLAKSGVSAADYEFAEQAPSSADRAEDFGLTAVVFGISIATIGVIGAWLQKKRRRTTFEAHFRTYDRDGHLLDERSVRLDTTSSDAPDPKVLEQLTNLTGVDRNGLQSTIARLGQ
jgi:hypothetical protein